MTQDYDPREFLLFGLKHFEIEVQKAGEQLIELEHSYAIEIESPTLFKLMHEGQVVGPFGDIEELCSFIRQDIELNYG